MNMSGLIPMFFALGLLGREQKVNKHWHVIAFLSLLAVLSRALIASVVLAAVTGYLIFVKEDRKPLLPILISCYGVFFIMILPYFGICLFPRDRQFIIPPDLAKEACPLPILINYLPEGFSLNSYAELCKRIFTLFIYAYLPIAPFLVKGVFRSQLIDLMVAWLLIGGIINPLILPFVSVPYFQRWQTLLVFPFCAYLANSLVKLSVGIKALKNLKVKLSIAIPYIMLGILYSSGLISWGSEWAPPNLVRSSVEVSQIEDCIACIEWLNDNAVSGACLIIEERFRGWVLTYMKREDIKIIMYYGTPGSRQEVGGPDGFKLAYETAISIGFRVVYFIWYSETYIEAFDEVYSHGSIAIYQTTIDSDGSY